MAPLRIRCVVSFSSQDPKYPVENLLLEERAQPWLCCPLDRSRQLRAELQLEQAGCIGYIDVGNSGSAFLQIEVGRSSWPPDQHYLTLLPTTTLMMPADAKQDRNRSGVRMFKEGDLLASALAEKWDRVRLTCSQPFNRHAQFGLAFIHIRTPEDSEERRGDPAAPSPCQASPESAPKPGVFRGTLSPAEPSCSTQEETLLKSQLQQLDSALLGKGLSPSGLSRPARLVLKAAASAHKAQRGATGQEQPLENKEKIAGRCQEIWVAGRFPAELLPIHASTCGEEVEVARASSSPVWGSWVECPLCQDRFPASEVEGHASGCGEEYA
ncbi:protein XNDC1N [Pituophis catenifer annectens]|uniref:protein XNDC1N n=1 Tax=Pituophis catenifer annectens TaxID=94852 RepID=UPI003993D564